MVLGKTPCWRDTSGHIKVWREVLILYSSGHIKEIKNKGKKSKIGAKGEIHETTIRQSWKAPYTHKATSFCLNLTRSVWHEHRQPSVLNIDPPRMGFLRTGKKKKKLCQTCPCPAVLSKKNWWKNLSPLKSIARWAAVPQPEDGDRQHCDLNVGDLQSLCQNETSKEEYMLGQLLEDELTLSPNNKSVPMNDNRAEQSLWRKSRHIHTHVHICAIPQHFREKSTFPWKIEDVFGITLISWTKNYF